MSSKLMRSLPAFAGLSENFRCHGRWKDLVRRRELTLHRFSKETSLRIVLGCLSERVAPKS